MDMLYGPPFKYCTRNPGSLVDRENTNIRLMGDSREILAEIATWDTTMVVYVSRTDCPQYASSCLRLFKITDTLTMHQLDIEQCSQIYPGRKTIHFKEIHTRTGIEYSDMLFFDNEARNCRDVATLGVCCVYTPDGMTMDVWNDGLEGFQKAQEARQREEEPELIVGNVRGAYW